MRYEAAIAMNLLASPKNLPESVIRNMALSVRNFMAHKKGTPRTDINLVINRIGKAKVPFPLNSKCSYIGNCGVEYNGRIYLFYTCLSANEEIKIRALMKRLWDVKQKTIVVCGMTFIYTSCSSIKENANTLRLADWELDLIETKKYTKLIKIDKKQLHPNTFPYQAKGIQMLCSGYRLMADEQGLGKTMQVLQFIQYEGIRPVLICCPATLKLNWKREILMWTKTTADKITVIEGTTNYPVKNRFVIINYDLLPYWADTLSKTDFDLVVCDECHYIQNEEAKRTKAFLQIAENIPDRLFISGTPFTSRPFQMFTALHMIAPKVFGNAYGFGMKFCNPSYYKGNVNFSGASNTKMLHAILEDGICIRRLKADVLEDLPEKLRVTVPIGLSVDEVKQSPVCSEIRSLEKKILQAKDPLATLEYQRQIAYLRKRDAANDWIRDFLESGKKLVVFGVHKTTLDAVEKAFPGISVRVDGSTPNTQRDKYVQKFQNDPDCKLFIGNIQAAGTGITLTAASDAVFIEFPYTFSETVQAEDRIHRIGAKNACMIYYFAAPNTIDERIIEIINKKAISHTAIFDGTGDILFKDIGEWKYTPIFN